ncbi:peptidoglycan-binding protein [Streptomyces sp. QH1-20]|uniref:peptidoglycan-binding domain-containing protein n=1 Tax=Streptomyces sp. QH1-20 TaxID=3240934 RepID=UPI00351210BB
MNHRSWQKPKLASTKIITALSAGLLTSAVLAGTAVAAPSAPSEAGTVPAASAAVRCYVHTTIGVYCGYYTGMDYAEYGDSGPKVKEIQALLVDYGYPVGPSGIDGEFGKDTRSAVKKYQAAFKLRVDGIVGPKTWSSLRMA